jgi:hypothetical protein
LKVWAIYIGIGLGVFALFFTVIVVLNRTHPRSTITHRPAPRSVPQTAASEIRTITASGGTVLATTEENFDALMKAANAKDEDYLRQMGMDGKLFLVPDGTKITILDGGMFKSKVSVLDGIQAGRSGWLPNEFMGN